MLVVLRAVTKKAIATQRANTTIVVDNSGVMRDKLSVDHLVVVHTSIVNYNSYYDYV